MWNKRDYTAHPRQCCESQHWRSQPHEIVSGTYLSSFLGRKQWKDSSGDDSHKRTVASMNDNPSATVMECLLSFPAKEGLRILINLYGRQIHSYSHPAYISHYNPPAFKLAVFQSPWFYCNLSMLVFVGSSVMPMWKIFILNNLLKASQIVCHHP